MSVGRIGREDGSAINWLSNILVEYAEKYPNESLDSCQPSKDTLAIGLGRQVTAPEYQKFQRLLPAAITRVKDHLRFRNPVQIQSGSQTLKIDSRYPYQTTSDDGSNKRKRPTYCFLNDRDQVVACSNEQATGMGHPMMIKKKIGMSSTCTFLDWCGRLVTRKSVQRHSLSMFIRWWAWNRTTRMGCPQIRKGL